MTDEGQFAFDEDIGSIDIDQEERKVEEALKRAVKSALDTEDPLSKVLKEAGIEISEIDVKDLDRTFEQQRETQRAHERDLADSVRSLFSATQAAGMELDGYENLHADAQAVLDKASQATQDAMQALADAKAIPGWQIWSGKTDKIARAQATLKKAQEYEQGEAKTESQAIHRERLMTARMDQSRERIGEFYVQVMDILRKDIERHSKSIDRRIMVIKVNNEKRQEVAKDAEVAEADVESYEAEVRELIAEQSSGSIERGSQAYTELQERIDTAQSNVSDAKGRLDTARGVRNELDEKIETLERQRTALITMKANCLRSLRIAEVGSRNMKEILQVRLELLQSTANLEVQNMLNDLSRTETLKAAQAASGAEKAVELARAKSDAQHAPTMRAQAQVKKMREEALELVSRVDDEIAAEYKRGYDTPVDTKGAGEDSSNDDGENVPSSNEGAKPKSEEFSLD